MTNINLIPGHILRTIEKQKIVQEKVDNNHKVKAAEKVARMDQRQRKMSIAEHEQMYSSGLAAPGIRRVKLKCRHCRQELECAESSQAAHTQTCITCMRRLKKQNA